MKASCFPPNSLPYDPIAKNVLLMIKTRYKASTHVILRQHERIPNFIMPRVFRIDDKIWTQTFRYDCDKLQFRAYYDYAAEKARYYGRKARDYTNDRLIMDGSAITQTWNQQCAFPYSAALSSRSARIKQSSVTTVIEVIEYFTYVLENMSARSVEDITDDERKKIVNSFLKSATNRIGRLVYYYTTAVVTPSLLKARTWHEAKKMHKKEVQKLATDHFYLVRCHAADLIAKTLLRICSSPELLHRALIEYNPDSDQLIPLRKRANIRKVIARRIDQFPEEAIAYEAATFTVDNCACNTLKTLYSHGYHPSRTLFGPKLSCHHFSALPLELIY